MGPGLRWIIGVSLLGVTACGNSADHSTDLSLDEVLGTPTKEELRQRVIQYSQSVSDLVAQCMIEHGFEYVSWVDVSLQIPEDPEEYDGLSDREIAKQYGFGISTIAPPERHLTADPNEQLYETLSEDGRAAYNLTLDGEVIEGLGGVSYTEVSPGQAGGAGCQQEAFDALSPESMPSLDLLEEYDGLLSEFEARIGSDPRMVKANRVVEQCLADSGLGVREVVGLDPVGIFFDAAYEEIGDVYPSLKSLEELVDTGELTGEDLRGIQVLERRIALLSYDCLSPLAEQAGLVRFELEPAFVAQNYQLLVEVAPGL